MCENLLKFKTEINFNNIDNIISKCDYFCKREVLYKEWKIRLNYMDLII